MNVFNTGLLNSILLSQINSGYLIGDKINQGYLIGKPRVDLKINGDINWDKKCASLSIEFKLFFI